MARIRTKTGSFAFASYQMKRAILENVVEHEYTTDDQERALSFFGGCAYCGASPQEARRSDHLIPVVSLGAFVPGNIVPSCGTCDDSKGAREFRDWMRKGDSAKSLRGRGLSVQVIERRLARIEEYRRLHSYLHRTEQQIFGENLSRYEAIIDQAKALERKARSLVEEVNKADISNVGRSSPSTHSVEMGLLERHGLDSGTDGVRSFESGSSLGNSVEKTVRELVSESAELLTPSRGAPFVVAAMDEGGVALLLGARRTRTRVSWDLLESVLTFLRGKDWVEIGTTFDTQGDPSTLDGHLKQLKKRAIAGWVAVLLERARLVEIDRSRPLRVRLRTGS